VSEIILRKLGIIAQNVTSSLSSINAISLTFDIWSPRKGARGFGCLTAHHVDVSGNPVSFVLNFKRLKYPHTGDAISRFIGDTLILHKLEGEIVSITTDNALNNISTIRKLESSLNLGHALYSFVH